MTNKYNARIKRARRRAKLERKKERVREVIAKAAASK